MSMLSTAQPQRNTFDLSVTREQRGKFFREHPKSVTPSFLDKIYEARPQSCDPAVYGTCFAKITGRGEAQCPVHCTTFLDKIYNVKYNSIDAKVKGTGHFFRSAVENKVDKHYPFRQPKGWGPRFHITFDHAAVNQSRRLPCVNMTKQTTRAQDLQKSYQAVAVKKVECSQLPIKYKVVDLNESKCVPFSRLSGRPSTRSKTPSEGHRSEEFTKKDTGGECSWMSNDITASYNRIHRGLARGVPWSRPVSRQDRSASPTIAVADDGLGSGVFF